MALTDEQMAALLAKLRAPSQKIFCEACEEPLDTALRGVGIHPTCAPPTLTKTIKNVVQNASKNAARSQQKLIGPSEIGHPCDRRIAYKLMDAPAVNARRDDWLATVGTAVHAWLEAAFQQHNKRLGRPRWLTEEKIWITDALSGHCDLYDTDTHAVIDHKILGVTKLRAIKRGDIPPEYRAQLHLYGYGHTRAGRRVDTVNLAIYPRNDSLSGSFSGHGLHLHTEKYDPTLARQALDRLDNIAQTCAELDLENHPNRFDNVTAKPRDSCAYCPYRNPAATTATAQGCPGKPDEIPLNITEILPKETK